MALNRAERRCKVKVGCRTAKFHETYGCRFEDTKGTSAARAGGQLLSRDKLHRWAAVLLGRWDPKVKRVKAGGYITNCSRGNKGGRAAITPEETHNIPGFRDASASKLMHTWRGEHTLDTIDATRTITTGGTQQASNRKVGKGKEAGSGKKPFRSR